MEKDRKEIIYFLANRYDLSTKQVQKIVGHQFRYTVKIMKKGDFDIVRIPYFGKFVVNPKRVKHINNLKKKKDG